MTINGMNIRPPIELADRTSLTLDEAITLNSMLNIAAMGIRRKITPMLQSG
jgi:hypothetical protein